MKLRYLTLLTVVILHTGCRPKDRVTEVVGKRPVLTVNLINMSEMGVKSYQYRLGGCLDVDGKIIVDKRQADFEDRRLKRGLGGCKIEVTDPTRSKQFDFSFADGVFWVSKEFPIGRDAQGNLVANADMERVYTEKDKMDGQHYNLQVPFQLPKDVRIENLNYTATVKCSQPLGEVEYKDVGIRSDNSGLIEFKNLVMPEQGIKIDCESMTVTGTKEGKSIVFSGKLDKDNVFTPIANQTMALNRGDERYLLDVENSDFPLQENVPIEEPISDIGVEISENCPDSAMPWLHPLDFECIACPVGSAYEKEGSTCRCPAKTPFLSIQGKVCQACPVDKPDYDKVTNSCR